LPGSDTQKFDSEASAADFVIAGSASAAALSETEHQLSVKNSKTAFATQKYTNTHTFHLL
jgi:hypothetical protein